MRVSSSAIKISVSLGFGAGGKAVPGVADTWGAGLAMAELVIGCEVFFFVAEDTVQRTRKISHSPKFCQKII
jgi:hypothetical protein